LKGNEQETLLLIQAQMENGKLLLQFETHQYDGCFLQETARAFSSSWILVCLVASHHALPSSVGSSALGMHLHDYKHVGNWECK